MSARVRVTAAELHAKWVSAESVGMIHDHEAQEVGVRMLDGTVYACTFDEHRAYNAEATP